MDAARHVLTTDRFVPPHEARLRRLRQEEVDHVMHTLRAVHTFAEAPAAVWKRAWDSFHRNDADFARLPHRKVARVELLRAKGIAGGAFRFRGGYVIVMHRVRRPLLRHELQHVLDDADDPKRYTRRCEDVLHFERRAHMAQHQRDDVRGSALTHYCA